MGLVQSIEIMTYVTQAMKDDDLTVRSLLRTPNEYPLTDNFAFQNIMLEDVGNDRDAISGLRAPTHYGRPNWDTIFSNIKDKHPDTE